MGLTMKYFACVRRLFLIWSVVFSIFDRKGFAQAPGFLAKQRFLSLQTFKNVRELSAREKQLPVLSKKDTREIQSFRDENGKKFFILYKEKQHGRNSNLFRGDQSRAEKGRAACSCFSRSICRKFYTLTEKIRNAGNNAYGRAEACVFFFSKRRFIAGWYQPAGDIAEDDLIFQG